MVERWDRVVVGDWRVLFGIRDERAVGSGVGPEEGVWRGDGGVGGGIVVGVGSEVFSGPFSETFGGVVDFDRRKSFKVSHGCAMCWWFV